MQEKLIDAGCDIAAGTLRPKSSMPEPDCVDGMAGAAGASADEPPLPAYLLTRPRRWCSLIVVCCALAVANGPVMCWQTLVPIMIEDEGVFRSTGHPLYHLDTIFAIGNGLGALTNLPAGMVFDRIGPRKTAIIGALFTSVGLVGLGLCMRTPSLNGGMYFFYPLTTIFAFLNSWGAFAYLWLLPESPALVNACICAAFSLSDCLGLLAAVLHKNHGVSLHAFFFTLGAGAMVAAWVSAMLLPSKEEFLRLAAHAKQEQLCVAELAAEAEVSVTGEKAAPSVTATASAKARVAAAAAEEEEAATAAEAEAEAAEAALPRHCCGRTWTACVPALERGLLRDTWACVVLLYPRASLVVLAHLLGLYLLPLSLLLKQYGYYLALFGETTATELVNLFSLLLGVCGAVSVICFGFVADRLGLIRSFVLVDCLALLFAAAVLAPGVPAQIVGEVLLTFLANAFYVMAPRLAMLYAPNELFGTYSGAVFFFLGCSQLVLTPIVDALGTFTASRLPSSSAWSSQAGAMTRFGVALWACTVILTASPLYRHWQRHPPPGTRRGQPPMPTMADVRTARTERARTKWRSGAATSDERRSLLAPPHVRSRSDQQASQRTV